MTKRTAVCWAIAVPFAVRLAMVACYVTSKREQTEFEVLGGVVFSAAAGVPFLAKAFRRLHAVIIATVFLPIMAFTLFWFSLVVATLLAGQYP